MVSALPVAQLVSFSILSSMRLVTSILANPVPRLVPLHVAELLESDLPMISLLAVPNTAESATSSV